jgi:hypothetical protein
MKTINDLESILADVETQLLRHRVDQLENILDAVSDEDFEEAYEIASQGLSQNSQESGGGLGSGSPEGYRGYSLEREGDIRFDDGSVSSAQAERVKALRWALMGGPADLGPQTQAEKAKMAKDYSRNDRYNTGDTDNSIR